MEAAGLNFDALRHLHDSANDLLHSSGIKTTVVHQEKWVHEISEASLKMVETCGNTRDVLLLVKDHLHCLRSTFRRVSVAAESTKAAAAGTGGAAGNKFSGYSLERKKLKKAMLRRLNSLKMMKNNKYCIINSNMDASSINQNLVIVINVLREVRIATMAIVESLMSLMSMPSPNRPQKSNKGFFESKLTRVDSLSYWENCDRTTLQVASKRLAAVEVDVEDLEEELDCIFKRLIQTRVSLLNILTAH